MTQFNISDHSHKRYSPLTNEWILVSPHRSKRPWQGQEEKPQIDKLPEYDPKCYLCPGNERAGGKQNPEYKDSFVFVNDFSALLKDVPVCKDVDDDIYKLESESGLCKVICFSPRHDLTIPKMEIGAVKKVVDIWQEEYTLIGEESTLNYVQIFENKGAVMGCSNPHPHGQIWASESIPVEVAKEDDNQKKYYDKHSKTLLEVYAAKELEKKDRIVYENHAFVVLVPYWAVWPFETMILPKAHLKSITQFSENDKVLLADAYRQITIIYDQLFETSFPYSSGIHQAPCNGKDNEHWQFHIHFYPPLLRSATVKKFMVGYEMLATPQRDITAEQAAERLRLLKKA